MSKDTVELAANSGFCSLAVKTNGSSFTISKPKTDTWLSYRPEKNGNVTLFSDYYYNAHSPRYSALALTSEDKIYTRTIVVKQLPNLNIKMNEEKFDVVVVGAGSGGMGAAYVLKRLKENHPDKVVTVYAQYDEQGKIVNIVKPDYISGDGYGSRIINPMTGQTSNPYSLLLGKNAKDAYGIPRTPTVFMRNTCSSTGSS